jgi:CubicO group peptidase (beta-lactamase class C family)
MERLLVTLPRRFVIRVALLVGAIILAAPSSPSSRGLAAEPHPLGLSADDRETLRRYARDTWRSFGPMLQDGGLPADRLCREGDRWVASVHTSPTDIACYLWSTMAAEAMGIIAADEADRRLDRALAAVARLERAHGFFFDWYEARTGLRLESWPDDGKPLRPFIPMVDNGWLAAALIMVRNTRPALRERADALLAPMDFGFFYDPVAPGDPLKHLGLMHLGYWTDTKAFANTYGMVNTEPRIASYIGIARGQVPPDHYFRVYRSRQPERGPQEQVPRGETRTYLGVRVFESHYTYRGMRIVPSWGGSMFEALMVPLLVPEARWAPRSWGVNHPLYVRAQIEHGLEEARYGFWGFSPASRPGGGYRNYGVDAIGADPDGYTSNDDETRVAPGETPPPRTFTNGVVTPHAAFLALPFAPREAMANLRALAERFPGIYGPYGFYDSVNVTTGKVSDCILVLDHGMIMVALANVLAGDAMQHAFADGAIEAAIRPLLAQEEFTAGPADAPGPVSDAEVESKAEAYMAERVERDDFSGAVLVARDGKPLFRRAYGLADREHDVPNTPETKFRLGSITKQFTAMAVMILQERGKLDVGKPIKAYWPGAPPAWDGITLHHLLTHTSGIPSYTGLRDYPRRKAEHTTPDGLIARFRDEPLEFPPGERFKYSNSGYAVLGKVIEVVSGQGYASFLKDSISRPLGMNDTGYDDATPVLKHRASGYARGPVGVVNAPYLDMTIPYAAGALYSTVDDLLKWDRALRPGVLVSKEALDRIFAPEKDGYAYGWSVGKATGRRMVGHGGGIDGFMTNILRFPDDGVCVVVLSNLVPSPVDRIGRDLSAIVFGEKPAGSRPEKGKGDNKADGK